MKICFIAPKAYGLFNEKVSTKFGGAEIQLYLLSKYTAKNSDYEVHFIVADYGQAEMETYQNIKVWKSLNFEKNLGSQIFNFFKTFRKVNADVYVQITLTPFTGIIGGYARFAKKKFIYMLAHDNEVDGTIKGYKNPLKRFLFDAAWKNMNVIISQNNFQKINLEKKGYKSHILKSSFELNFTFGSEKKFHFWVARTDYWKRPELFISLAESFPDEKFLMICPKVLDTDEKYYNQLKAKAYEVPNLEFISEYVPFSKLNDYFLKAKTFVITSSQEGYATTMIQAGQNGLPIVSLNVNPDNFITENNCGIFCNDDFELLKTSFKHLIEDELFYNELSKNIINYVKNNHDVVQNTAKFLEIIE